MCLQNKQGKERTKKRNFLVSKQLREHFSGLFVKRCQTAATLKDWTRIHHFQKWIHIVGTQMGRHQINLPGLSPNRRQHRFVSYSNVLHSSTTLQSCLLHTWTLKLRETFVQKPNLVWTRWQSSEETAILHRDFLLPPQQRGRGKMQILKAVSQYCCCV